MRPFGPAWSTRSLVLLTVNKRGQRAMAPDVDVIIPVYAEPVENIERTIDGLLRQDTRGIRRIVVVDDGSPEPITLSSQPASVEFFRIEENRGIAGARNAAAATLTAEFLLFLNCDVVLPSGWLRAGLGFMESNPRTAAVGGPIVPRVGPRLLRSWRMRFLENAEQRGAAERKVTWLTGHATLVRRAMFEEVGGFHLGYRKSGEDHELSRQLRARGYEIYHLPQLTADSYEIPSIDLYARKVLRHDGWDLSLSSNNSSDSNSTDVQPVQALPASLSVLRSFAIQSGRDLCKLRLPFLPIDAAVAVRSLALVWAAALRRQTS